jgi:hypothetical protein
MNPQNPDEFYTAAPQLGFWKSDGGVTGSAGFVVLGGKANAVGAVDPTFTSAATPGGGILLG